MEKQKVNLWRILAYFMIYSFVGYVVETLFALINYNVLESRKSFLYGPFCGIYGVGAIVLILTLRYFNILSPNTQLPFTLLIVSLIFIGFL